MSKLSTLFMQNNNLLISPTPLPSFPSPKNSSTSNTKTSPILLLIIIIISIIIFLAGILHLIIRCLIRRPYISRNPENNFNNLSTEVLQRQLQQLFRLHDSGLDQALIDALPLFYHKDIMGIKEPFDCAVCLCKFCDQDKLRLLPLCSHAFHVGCIDTWLLSNSTCPLCRGSLLVGSGLENQEFKLEDWREFSFGRSINCENSFRNNNNNNSVWFSNNNNSSNNATIMEDNESGSRVLSVRLGKFRSLNESLEESEDGETSSRGGGGYSSQLDARRCYSLGSYQYVVDDSNLQVALSTNVGDTKIEKLIDGDVEGKKISRRNRGESFSVSKIWLWSKKGKIQGSSENNTPNVHGNGGPPRPLNVVLPLSIRDYAHD